MMWVMYGGKDTLYDVLGVHRSAQPGDLVRAYRTKRAQMLVGSAADDPQAALVHEAYEVLSDPQKRAAYDASLRGDAFLRPERPAIANAPKYGLIAGVVVVVLALLVWWRRSAGPAATIPQEIVASVARAVGRVERLDMQGHSTLLGHAFAIEQGVRKRGCRARDAEFRLHRGQHHRHHVHPARPQRHDEERDEEARGGVRRIGLRFGGVHGEAPS